MSLERVLLQRSGSKCELCGNDEKLGVYDLPFSPMQGVESKLLCCGICEEQINNSETIDVNHWRCLNDSMWSAIPAVQVMSWRMLQRLSSEGWPQDLLDMMYLDETTLAWAEAAGDGVDEAEKVVHRDSNGAVLEAGDSVVLIKDLKVKGSSLVAKQGTAVRRISLDHENEKYIEGKVEGQHIVLVTDYVKKL